MAEPDQRWVPAVKLTNTTDPRLQRREGWGIYSYFIPSAFEGLLSNLKDLTVQGGIAISLSYRRRYNDLDLQFYIRTSGAWRSGGVGGVPSVPVNLLLRDGSGEVALLSAGPVKIGFGGSWGFSTSGFQYLGRQVSEGPDYFDSGSWYPITVRLNSASNWISAYCSTGNQASAVVEAGNVSVANLPQLEAIVLFADQQFMIAEIRLWEGLGSLALSELQQLKLDGREPGLIGYWKFVEGQGNRIYDSSRYGHHGTMNGGEWIPGGYLDSRLSLDCRREVGRESLRQLREEIGQQLHANRLLREDIDKLTQEKQRLNTHIGQLKANQKNLDDRFKQDLQAREAALQKLEDDYRAWQDDIEDGGKVAVSTFSNTIAQEIDRVTQRLNTAQSPYALQSLDLEVKALPVAGQHDTGMRLRFPAMDDKKIQSDQLSTLRMSFAARPSEPVRARAAVPDVRGCTEALARRQLGLAGFRVEVLDQAAISEEEIGRVVGQVPSPDILAEPDKIVRVFIGQPSGTGAPHPTLPAGEGDVVTGKDRKR